MFERGLIITLTLLLRSSLLKHCEVVTETNYIIIILIFVLSLPFARERDRFLYFSFVIGTYKILYFEFTSF